MEPDASDSMPSRVEPNNYVAEVLQAGTTETFWYYTIRRKNSNEILGIAKFETYDQALTAAREALARLNRAAAAF